MIDFLSEISKLSYSTNS